MNIKCVEIKKGRKRKGKKEASMDGDFFCEEVRINEPQVEYSILEEEPTN